MLAEQVIEGRLTLDGSVDQYLPEFKGTFVGGITLRELATHTSGLPRMPCEDSSVSYCFHPADPSNPYADYTWSQLRDYLMRYTPAGYDASKPRPSYARDYSNTGFGLLGYLITQTGGAESFEAMLKQRITNPLHLLDTRIHLSPEQYTRFIGGYDITNTATNHWDFDVMAPTGAIRSTAADMMIYVRSNLDPESLLDQPVTQNLALAMILSHAEGLGWDSLPGAQVVWKDGETGGFAATILIEKSTELGGFILSNLANSPDDQTILNLPFGESLPNVLGIALTASQLQLYVGTYECNNGIDVKVSLKGQFLAMVANNFLLESTLRATSQTDFNLIDGFFSDGWYQVSFGVDASGTVTGLTLHLKDEQGIAEPDLLCKKNN